jgi:hypothetical protein
MPSAATTMAAAQASKNAFIVFHLAGLAERESNMMPGYVWHKDADRHDGSSLIGPCVFFAMGRHGDTIQSTLQKGTTCRARRPMSASGGMKGQAIQVATCEAGHTHNLPLGLDTSSPERQPAR